MTTGQGGTAATRTPTERGAEAALSARAAPAAGIAPAAGAADPGARLIARDTALAMLAGRLDTARHQCAQVEAENARLIRDLARLTQEMRAQDSMIAALRQDLSATRAEIAALHASTSWRLTAPLRGLRLWLARLRGG